MKKYRVPGEPTCPICHTLLTGANPLEDDIRPKPGDFTVCIVCASILRFAEDFTLLRCTPAELAELERQQPESYKVLVKFAKGAAEMARERERELKVKYRVTEKEQ
jgi:hypothetical protein